MMADKAVLKLEQTRIANGVWEGTFSGAKGAAPAIEALHMGRKLDGVEVLSAPGSSGQLIVRVPIPAWAMNDGVQTFLLRLGEVTLAQFTLVAGEPLEADIRAELSLLRAELDLLKRAFQRHCRES
jgi:hypothetical protein